MQAPCKDCNSRKLGCHSACSKYKLFNVINTAVRERKNRERYCENAADDIVIKIVLNKKRHKGIRV